MITAKTVKNKLESLSIDYDLIVRNGQQSLQSVVRSMGLSSYSVVRSAMLCDGDYRCLVVIPHDNLFDFAGLKSLTQRNLRFADRADIESIFADCLPAHLPPFGQLYHVDTFYDTSLQGATSVLFEAGTDTCLVRTSNQDFQRLQQRCQNGYVSVPATALILPQSGQLESMPIDFYRYQSLLPESRSGNRLSDAPVPELSPIVKAVINAHADSDLTLAGLKEILIGRERLYDQICLVINSDLFKDVLGPIPDDLEDEPEEIEIYDCLYSLVLGLVVNDQFDIQTDGLLSKDVLWRQALLSTALAVRLADEDYRTSVSLSILILSGLLQNVGLFYYAQEQADRYYLLNRLIELNPGYDLIQLEWLFSPERLSDADTANSDKASEPSKSRAKAEQSALEENHAVLGAAIVEYWDLAEEVVYAIRYHHDPGYNDSFYQCPNLLMVANCLLLAEDTPTMDTCRLSGKLFKRLKVSPERCRQLASRFKSKHEVPGAGLRVRDQSGVKF